MRMNIQVIGHGNLMNDAFYPAFLINNVLICAPNGVLKQLQKMEVNIDDINVIVIPHMHGDQYFDLPLIIAHEQRRKRERPLIIVGPKELRKKLNKLIKMAYNERLLDDLKVSFIIASNIQNANVTADLFFTFVNVKHAKLKTAYGLIIKNEKSSVGFSFESKTCPGLSYLIKEVKNCVINISDNEDKNTLTFDEFQKISDEVPINFIPVGYPDALRKKLEANKRTKMIDEGEQFYI